MMSKPNGKIFVLIVVASFLGAGCATTKPRRPEPPVVDQQNQVAQLQSQLQAKDQQIQELQARVDTYEQALQNTSTYTGYPKGNAYRPSSKVSKGKSSMIRVPDVTVEDVQRALLRAGFEPGPVDGHAGKRTKAALRKFQRKNHLKADGIVGEETWAHLK